MRSFKEIAEIIEKMRKDPKVVELLKECEEQKDEFAAYAEIADKLGYDVTAEDLKSFLEETSRRIAGKTDDVITQLPDEELKVVAGGKDHNECKDTYMDKENCWYNDGCDVIYHMYNDYICKHLPTCGSPMYDKCGEKNVEAEVCGFDNMYG